MRVFVRQFRYCICNCFVIWENAYNCLCVSVCVCVCVCVRACVRACVCVSTVFLRLCLSVVVPLFPCPFSFFLACLCSFAYVFSLFVCVR